MGKWKDDLVVDVVPVFPGQSLDVDSDSIQTPFSLLNDDPTTTAFTPFIAPRIGSRCPASCDGGRSRTPGCSTACLLGLRFFGNQHLRQGGAQEPCCLSDLAVGGTDRLVVEEDRVEFLLLAVAKGVGEEAPMHAFR